VVGLSRFDTGQTFIHAMEDLPAPEVVYERQCGSPLLRPLVPRPEEVSQESAVRRMRRPTVTRNCVVSPTFSASSKFAVRPGSSTRVALGGYGSPLSGLPPESMLGATGDVASRLRECRKSGQNHDCECPDAGRDAFGSHSVLPGGPPYPNEGDDTALRQLPGE